MRRPRVKVGRLFTAFNARGEAVRVSIPGCGDDEGPARPAVRLGRFGPIYTVFNARGEAVNVTIPEDEETWERRRRG